MSEIGIHTAHRADGWTDPDPLAPQPFTDKHFDFCKGIGALEHIMRESNSFLYDTKDIAPKQGCSAVPILPAIPAANIKDLVGKKIPMMVLFYSPLELHTNAIGNHHPATAVDDDDRLISDTWYFVQLFTGEYVWIRCVKIDAHPYPYPYRTSPTEVFAESDWEVIETRYKQFLRNIMKHPDMLILLGSKATVQVVEEAFGGELSDYLDRFVSTAEGGLQTVVHPEKMRSREIRNMNTFPSECEAYDVVFTIFRREAEGPDAEKCEVGKQLLATVLAGGTPGWLVSTGKDIIAYLQDNYDSNMLVSDRNVPKLVQSYANNNSAKIEIFLCTRLDSFDFEQLVLSQLHQFMSSNGGNKQAELAAEAHQFLNDGMGRGESWGDVCGVLEEMGLWSAYKDKSDRFLEHVKNIEDDIQAGRIAEVGNNKCIVLPNNASTMKYVERIAKEYDASDWRRIYLSKLNVGDGRLSIDLSRFVEERDEFGTKVANERAKEEADNIRSNTTESLRRDRVRADSRAASANNPPGPNASMLALISKSTKGDGKRQRR